MLLGNILQSLMNLVKKIFQKKKSVHKFKFKNFFEKIRNFKANIFVEKYQSHTFMRAILVKLIV